MKSRIDTLMKTSGNSHVWMPRIVAATTETDAERAWRYGESAFRFRRANGVTWFGDGSCLTKWSVDTPRGVRHTLDQVRARTGMNLDGSYLDAVDWSAA
ncbi:MAG: hypothetical protein RKP73_18525 [Candidatus Contendobacter sp.]|nr:hypothetical protein [Candidatus Contendobacter sp.]